VRSIPEVVVLSKPPYGGRNLLAKSLSFHPCRSPSTGEESSIRSERSGPFSLSPGFAPAETQCPSLMVETQRGLNHCHRC
jgi:hypothetical protein